MPRMVEKEFTQRQPEESLFNNTPQVNVVARPNDPYVQPGDQGLNNLITSLSGFNQGLESFKQIKQTMNEQDAQQGYLDELTGKPVSKKGWAYINARDEVRGQIDAGIEFEKEMSAFFSEKGNTLTPDKYEAEVAKLQQKYLEGKSDAYAKGFAPKAVEVEDKYAQQYQNNLNQQAREQATQDLKASTTLRLDEAMQATFGVSLSALYSDPEKYKEFVSNPENAKKLGELMRGIVTDQQALAATLGFDKNEAGAVVLAALTEPAIEYGLPVMDFIDVPDKDGVNFTSTVNGEQAISMKMNSERNREARLNQIASDSEQKKAEDAHTLVNSALTEIYAAAQEKNPVAAMNKIYTKLLQDPTYKNTLDPSEYQNLLNTAQRLGSTGGFSTTTDGAFANEIVVKAAKGQLTMNDVLEFKETHSITQEDFRLALSMVPSPGDGGSGGSTGFFGDNQMLGRYYDSLKASLVPKNSISGIFDPQIEADFDKIFGELALQYMYKNGGQRPTPAEFEEIFSKPMTEMLGKNTANPTKKDYNYVSAEEEMGNRQAKARDSKIYDGVTQAFNDGLTREQVTAEMDQQGISVEERKHALTQFGVDYVKNQVAKGTKVKDIRKNLRAMGYRDDEIDYYFRRNGVK